jgi:hypothetical protein
VLPLRNQPSIETAPAERTSARLSVAIAVAVIALATWGISALDRAARGQDYTHLVAGDWTWELQTRPAEVLFLGNSLAGWGVDPELFESLTGRRTGMLRAGASASAWWYLVLENFVVRAKPKPGTVVLCFGDNSLTLTTLLVGEQAMNRVERLLDEEDARSQQLVGETSRSPSLELLRRHWPLVGARGDVRERVEAAVKGYVATVARRAPGDLEAALAQTFDLREKDIAVIDRKELEARIDMDPRLYDFERMKERSFLPDILDLADAHDLPIVFVRMPLSPKFAEQRRPREAALDRYLEQLESYLRRRGFALLDFGTVPGLGEHHFAVGDHLNDAGRALFTRLLASELAEHLPPPRSSAATPDAADAASQPF